MEIYALTVNTPRRFLSTTLESKNGYLLVLFFGGAGRCKTPGDVHPFESGDVLLAGPGCTITYMCDEEPASPIVAAAFPAMPVVSAAMEAPLNTWTDAFLQAAAPCQWVHLPQRQMAELAALLHPLYQECSASRPGGVALTGILTRGLVAWLARAYYLEHPSSGPGQQGPPRGTALVEHVKRILAREFTEPLSLDAVARRCFVTPAYLSGLFRKKTGLSFTRYLNLTRIDHACRLLVDTDELVVDIGEASGFNYTPHFNLTFRKLTGFTPLEYRRQFQKGPPTGECEG